MVDLASLQAPDKVAHFAVTDDNRQAIAQLCAQLDGLPLAIELAATRLRSLAASDVVQRLDSRFALLVGCRRDRQPRQRTLRALIDWSFERCTPDEQLLWTRLFGVCGQLRSGAFQQGHTQSLERLRRDHPNLRAALAWSLSRLAEKTGAALAGALQYHWFTDAFLGEGVSWLEQALQAARDPTAVRAEALWAAALGDRRAQLARR